MGSPRRRSNLWVALAFLLLAGCPGGGSGATPAPADPSVVTATAAPAMTPRAPAPPTRTALVITGETHGWLEPCGCAEGMLGGVARRVAFVRALGALGALEPLVIDAGDQVTGPGPQSDLKLDGLERALRLLPLGAVALGSRDLPFRERLRAALGVALLEPGDAPRIVETRAGPVRVAVAKGGGARAAFEAAGRAIAPVTVAADVVLYEGSRDEARAFAASPLVSAPPALIVAGRGEETPEPEERLPSGTLLVTTSERAKYALVVVLERRDGRLTATLERPPVSLGARIPDDPEAAQVVQDYRDAIFAANLAEKDEKKPLLVGGSYMGPATCGACHAPQHAVYEKMRHAKSLEDLRPKKAERDPECLRCHATGAGFASGFTSEAATPDLAHVSCESCHGVGGNHVAAMMQGLGAMRGVDPEGYGRGDYGRIPEPRKLCVECHDKENSPRFDFDAYWAKIKHGREGLPPR